MAALPSYCAAQPLHHLLRKSARPVSLAADHLSTSVCAVHCRGLQHSERVTPHSPKTLSAQQVCKPEWKAPKLQSLFMSCASQMSRRSSRRAQGTETALGYTDQAVTLDCEEDAQEDLCIDRIDRTLLHPSQLLIGRDLLKSSLCCWKVKL